MPQSINKTLPCCLRLVYGTLVFCVSPLLLAAQTLDTTGVHALRTKAVVMINEGAFNTAIPLLEQVDSLYRLGNDTGGRAFCLYQKALCYHYQTKNNEAQHIYRQIITLLQDKDSEAQAPYLGKAWRAYIGILLDNGELDAAIDSCRRQIQHFQLNPRKNNVVLTYLYKSMADITSEQNLYEENVYFQKKLLSMTIDTASANDIYGNLAMTYFFMGHLDSSAYYFKLAEENLAKRSFRANINRRVIALYINIGYVNTEKGDYAKALEYLFKAKTINEKVLENDIEGLLYIHSNIGRVYTKRKQYPQALVEFQTALAILDSMKYAPLRVMAQIWSSTASCYGWLGDSVNAERYWHKALDDTLARKYTNSLISIYKDITLYKHARKQYEEEIALYEQVIQIIRQRHGPQYVALADFYAGLANALNSVGRYDEALTWTDKALRIHCPSNSCFQIADQVPNFEGVLAASVLPYTLLAKGEALLGKLRAWPADRSLSDAAKQAAEQARQAVVFYRQRHQGAGVENYEWLQKSRQIYALAVRIATQRADFETAFQRADQSRAVLLAESARAAEAKRFAGVPADLINRERQLIHRIAYYERKNLEPPKNETAADKYRRDTTLFNLQHAQRALAQLLEKDYPRYYAIRYDGKPVYSRVMQAKLAPTTAFIEYFVDENEGNLYIFVIDAQHGLRMQVIPWQNNTIDQVLQFHQLSQSILLKRNENRLRFIAQSHALYRQFIQPILTYLQGKNQLVIVAEGDLLYLPFELLIENPQDQSFEQLPYLLRRYTIAYNYSADLYWRNTLASPHHCVHANDLVAFAPTFDAIDQSQPNTIRNQDIVSRPLLGEGGTNMIFRPLPYSEVEVRTLAGLYGAPRTTLLLDKYANEARLKVALSSPCCIAHLATHSFADKEHPQFSGIACYQKDSIDNEEDGVLYAGGKRLGTQPKS